jgi:GT2 family glycosyltransferase
MKQKRVAIVILNWNGKSFLERFLDRVKTCSPPEAEIVVADNASADDSLPYLRKNHPEVRILAFRENLGFAGGYNAALNALDHEYFVLLNSDIEVSPNWIEPVISLMDGNERIAACQPKILSWHDRTRFEYAGASGGFLDKYGYPFCRGRMFDTLEADEGQYNDTREVFWATGACMFVRGGAYKELGGFDDRFFAHMEEIDLCWRMQNKGYKVMACPDSHIFHIGGGTLPKSSPTKTFLNFRNSLWMLAKNLPARKFYPTIMIRLALDKLAAAKFLLTGHPEDCLAVYRALWAFLRKFRQMRNASRDLPDKLPGLMFRRSIVAMYYLKGRKKFSALGNLPGANRW